MQAAQALEPAALIALQLIAPGARVVLVGDPKQLPPTVLSRAAEASHLAQSLFERLQQVSLLQLSVENALCFRLDDVHSRSQAPVCAETRHQVVSLSDQLQQVASLCRAQGC